jgi:hypothetical protein
MDPENEETSTEYSNLDLEDDEQEEETEPADEDEVSADEAGDTTPEPEQQEEEESTQQVPAVAIDGEDADDAVLRELLGDDAYAALQRKQEKRMAIALQSMSAASINVTTAATQNPELFRVYGPRIQHTISQLPAELRSKPEAVNVAVANLLMEEANKNGIGAALSKLAGMAAGHKVPATKVPKAPIPPEQRPPSPGSGVRPMVREGSRAKKELAARFGMSARAIDDLMEDLE